MKMFCYDELIYQIIFLSGAEFSKCFCPTVYSVLQEKDLP